MKWLTYAAYGAMLAGLLPLFFMSVGYFFVSRKKRGAPESEKSARGS